MPKVSTRALIISLRRMPHTPLPMRRQVSVFVSPFTPSTKQSNFDTKISDAILPLIKLRDAEEHLKESVPLSFRNSGCVYFIIVKINGQRYLKLGICSRFFSTINKSTGKRTEQRHHSIIRGLRTKLGCEAKICKILAFIKEYSGEDGDLTLNDIEAYLLKQTRDHLVNPSEKTVMKEYRDYDAKTEILEVVKRYVEDNELEAYISEEL